MSNPKPTGQVSVYVCWSMGFNGALRPAHDTPPTSKGSLTLEQVNTLTAMIQRYVGKCRKKNAAAPVEPPPPVFTNCNVCGIKLRTPEDDGMGMCDRCARESL